VVCGIGYVAINSATKAHRPCRQNTSNHPITSPAAPNMIPSAVRVGSRRVGMREPIQRRLFGQWIRDRSDEPLSIS
jgi:hypothetical protein